MMRYVIITGASHGIGKAIAASLHITYMVIAIDKEKPKHSFFNRFFLCDLSDREALQTTIMAIQKEIPSLYGLINNAGRFDHTPLEDQHVETWENILAVNLRAPYMLSKAFAPLLRQAHGHIINIASTRASMSEAGTEAYAASKGGLASLTHALSLSLFGNVSVNSISPGWINTDETYLPTPQEQSWHPSGRVGKPSDIAEVVSFLLARSDGFITGSDFVIDGGVTRKMVYP